MPTNDQATWHRLLFWQTGPAESERLAAEILGLSGFKSIDPAHPLGGPDGCKDIVLTKDGRRWIGAAYFAHGEKGFAQVKKKFIKDFSGVTVNDAQGFAFVTNQPLSITKKAKLEEIAGNTPCEIFHLERLRLILDSLVGVPIRHRYLGIEASKEDLVGAVGQVSQFGQFLEVRASMAPATEARTSMTLNVAATDELSFAELARLAQEQGKSEMHRGYIINRHLLPAFANFDHPVPPLFSLDDFPPDIANCNRAAHESAMLLFFLQRCIGLSHMELLGRDERTQIVRVVERLWRCVIRLRPLINKAQSTLFMVGANRGISPCAHMAVYMCASHFLQEVVQASEQIGYTSAAEALSQAGENDALPYNPEQIVAKWPEVVRSLLNNWAISEGYRLLSDAFNDLAAEAVRATRFEKGLPLIPAWVIMPGAADARP